MNAGSFRLPLLLAIASVAAPAASGQDFPTPTFHPPVSLELPGVVPKGLAIGDLNNNGHMDIVVGMSQPAQTDVDIAVFLNDGAGGFTLLDSFPAGVRIYRVALGDLDGDGYLDLVASNGGAVDPPLDELKQVSVLINDGEGGFGPPTVYPVDNRNADVALADLDGDGHLDIISANTRLFGERDGDSLSVLINDGAGAFGAATDFDIGFRPWEVEAASVNSDVDGFIDAIVTLKDDGQIAYFEGINNGTFFNPVFFEHG